MMHSSTSAHAILVAGMHRSGTSAATRIISQLGARLPDHLMPANPDYNASGFWESTEVVALNDRILADTGSAWDDVLPLDTTLLAAADLEQIGRHIDTLLEQQFGAAASYVIKDPRLCRLLPLWLPVLQGRGEQVHIAVPIRHPAEVAASLSKRDGFALEKSLHLWLRHMLATIRDSAGTPFGIVVYDDILADWRGSFRRLADELQLVWPSWPDPALEAEIDRFVAPELRHHALGPAPLTGKVGEMAAELYAAMVARAPDLAALAEEMHGRLSLMEQPFHATLRDVRAGQILAERQLEPLQLALQRRDQEFDLKCNHIEQLEILLDKERQTFKQLEQEFQTKCQHVELLQAEVAKLTALAAPNVALHRQQQLCRADIVRAEAQLDLLKSLWLDLPAKGASSI